MLPEREKWEVDTSFDTFVDAQGHSLGFEGMGAVSAHQNAALRSSFKNNETTGIRIGSNESSQGCCGFVYA